MHNFVYIQYLFHNNFVTKRLNKPEMADGFFIPILGIKQAPSLIPALLTLLPSMLSPKPSISKNHPRNQYQKQASPESTHHFPSFTLVSLLSSSGKTEGASLIPVRIVVFLIRARGRGLEGTCAADPTSLGCKLKPMVIT